MGTTGAVKTAAITKTRLGNILRERKTEKSTGGLARKTGIALRSVCPIEQGTAPDTVSKSLI